LYQVLDFGILEGNAQFGFPISMAKIMRSRHKKKERMKRKMTIEKETHRFVLSFMCECVIIIFLFSIGVARFQKTDTHRYRVGPEPRLKDDEARA